MIENKKKGNQQPIPIPVFNDALIEFLEKEKPDYNVFLPNVLTYNKGFNSAGKILVAIRSSLKNNTKLLKVLKHNFSGSDYSKLTEKERYFLLTSLLCLKYPFVYEMLQAFAKLFVIQDTVNKRYIIDTLASKFGSNLSLEHTIGANLKTLVDATIIKRVKQGLYSKSEPVEVCDFVKEAWIYTWFELNGRKKIAVDDLRYEPFICYLINTDIDWDNTKILQIKKDFCNQTWIESVK